MHQLRDWMTHCAVTFNGSFLKHFYKRAQVVFNSCNDVFYIPNVTSKSFKQNIPKRKFDLFMKFYLYLSSIKKHTLQFVHISLTAAFCYGHFNRRYTVSETGVTSVSVPICKFCTNVLKLPIFTFSRVNKIHIYSQVKGTYLYRFVLISMCNIRKQSVFGQIKKVIR